MMHFLCRRTNNHFVLLLLCVSVHSGVAFATDRHVSDLFDSTAFNVAMFAMGWAATRWRMKGNDTPLGWCLKTMAIAPLAFVPPTEKESSKPYDKASAKVDPEDGIYAVAVAALAEPQTVAAVEQSPGTALLPWANEEKAYVPLLRGLCALVNSRVAACSGQTLPPWHRCSCYHNKGAEEMDFSEFLEHIHWYFDCSSPCLVLALIYFERALKQSEGAKLILSVETCNRLFLTSLLAAVKFHDDDWAPYSNAFYADVGKVGVSDLNAMERQLCKSIDWQFNVSPDEYMRYNDMIAAAAQMTPAI